VQNITADVNDTSKIEIRTSNISGKGTFARRNILCGEYITTLSGKPVNTDPDVAQICAEFGISGDDPLQIDDAVFLVLDHASKTINHSCNPNTGLRNKSDLYAIRNISIDEEITYDYSTTSGINDTWTMNCGCASEICRKIIGNVLSIPPLTISRYFKLDVLPDFIKTQLSKKAGMSR